jgi:hypothetical protein
LYRVVAVDRPRYITTVLQLDRGVTTWQQCLLDTAALPGDASFGRFELPRSEHRHRRRGCRRPSGKSIGSIAPACRASVVAPCLSLGVEPHLRSFFKLPLTMDSQPSHGVSMNYATSAPATAGGSSSGPVRSCFLSRVMVFLKSRQWNCFRYR